MTRLQDRRHLHIAMFCVHSHPLGRLGTTDTGGMSVYIRQVAFELGEKGHQVDIFTRFNGLYDEEILELSENVRLIQVEAGGKRSLNRLSLYAHLDDFIKGVEAFRLQSGMAYDVIHSHYWLSGLAGLWAQNHWLKPLVITFHTVGEVKKKLSPDFNDPKIRLMSERELMKSCDLVIALTEFEKQEIIRLFDVPQSKISVIPCGVNLETFYPVDKMGVRKYLGMPGNEMDLLYVGRIDPMKGLDRLLEAVALLKQKIYCRLLIIGGDDSPCQEQDHLTQMARNLNIEECVTLAGSLSQQELPHYYSAADVFVFPSYYESFGLAGLEALACGTPVVATNVGAYSQLLTNPIAGRTVLDSSPESLAEKIEEVFIAGKKCHIQSGVIRNTVKQYTWKRVVDSLHLEYLRLVRANHTKAAATQGFPVKTKLKYPQSLIQ
ncbi:MAG: glycosyltransferase [Bacteroidota bacterium]